MERSMPRFLNGVLQRTTDVFRTPCLRQWSPQPSGRVSVQVFPGKHYFPRPHCPRRVGEGQSNEVSACFYIEEPRFIKMSSSACYKCNRMGHFARECPQGGGGGGRGDRGRDRDGAFGRGREKCFKCNQFGHFARECKEDQDLCYRCNGVGHIAKDCQQGPEQSCYNCNKTGHIARSCPEGGNDSGRFAMQSCYNCNKTGHIARNCTETGGKTCYICGKTGHISRECDQDDRKSGSLEAPEVQTSIKRVRLGHLRFCLCYKTYEENEEDEEEKNKLQSNKGLRSI
ncbi:hypothetical protein KM043_017727 [Ampulex compressa]|nr:hypothetical protein KM043_017727 [Ampulex compressa]